MTLDVDDYRRDILRNAQCKFGNFNYNDEQDVSDGCLTSSTIGAPNGW